MKQRTMTNLLRSSAAEYLTYAAVHGEDKESVEVRYENENLWLTQKMMSMLYGVSVAAINQHIKKVLADHELERAAVIKQYLITAADGKRYRTNHYNLQMIIAVGFKVNTEQAVQFRKWANIVVKEFTIKGWAMDDERLKNNGTVLTEKYFEEQLEKIREIRMSERRFYQKITDIYATSLDYDSTAKGTQRFFVSVQNKLHYSVHGKTAAEVIYQRADATKERMGLMNWKDVPNGKIQKYDVAVAKNYLTKEELEQLSRLVSAYLDLAEAQAKRHIPMTMADWEERLNGFLALWDREVLKDNGKITAAMAKLHAETEFEKYRVVQDRLYKSDFDRFLVKNE